MPKRKRYPRGSSRKSVRHDWALRTECRHGLCTVIDVQGRQWRYCHRCNFYEIVGLVEREADEEGA